MSTGIRMGLVSIGALLLIFGVNAALTYDRQARELGPRVVVDLDTVYLNEPPGPPCRGELSLAGRDAVLAVSHVDWVGNRYFSDFLGSYDIGAHRSGKVRAYRTCAGALVELHTPITGVAVVVR